MPFKAMLAKDADFNKLRFPLLASPKLDGVRATVINGVLMSRSLKPIPNKHVQSLFANCEYFDGELIVGDPTSKSVYLDTVSLVMSHDRVEDCSFYAFDHIQFADGNYNERSSYLKQSRYPANVVILEQKVIRSMDELLDYEDRCLDLGYEGVISRDPFKPYKYGRSTANSQELIKIKRFQDAECIIVGLEEQMHNGNEATTNELGRTQRSSHAAGKVPMGTLGALMCVTTEGVPFNIGTGFSAEQRQEIWDDGAAWIGKTWKYKFFPVGTNEAPRHPVSLGPRSNLDMS